MPTANRTRRWSPARDFPRRYAAAAVRTAWGRAASANIAERQPLRGFAPQHVELVSKDQDLCFQRSARPEQSSQGAPDQPAKVAHRQRVSADSQSQSAGLGLRYGQGSAPLRPLRDLSIDRYTPFLA